MLFVLLGNCGQCHFIDVETKVQVSQLTLNTLPHCPGSIQMRGTEERSGIGWVSLAELGEKGGEGGRQGERSLFQDYGM